MHRADPKTIHPKEKLREILDMKRKQFELIKEF
jgi:hypothetical protein